MFSSRILAWSRTDISEVRVPFPIVRQWIFFSTNLTDGNDYSKPVMSYNSGMCLIKHENPRPNAISKCPFITSKAVLVKIQVQIKEQYFCQCLHESFLRDQELTFPEVRVPFLLVRQWFFSQQNSRTETKRTKITLPLVTTPEWDKWNSKFQDQTQIATPFS